mmetsp:Transcript_18913/g.40954  ORF Transcript_18913/g.40954 Transcript_18913/m.40954 type:complete len:92 (-) Transcript_18913:430-705(-)
MQRNPQPNHPMQRQLVCSDEVVAFDKISLFSFKLSSKEHSAETCTFRVSRPELRMNPPHPHPHPIPTTHSLKTQYHSHLPSTPTTQSTPAY